MDIFNNKKSNNTNIKETCNTSPKPAQKRFRDSIRIESFNLKARLIRLKEDLIAGRIKEKDLNKKDLDGVTRLLKEELAQNEMKIKNLQAQIAKHKKNN